MAVPEFGFNGGDDERRDRGRKLDMVGDFGLPQSVLQDSGDVCRQPFICANALKDLIEFLLKLFAGAIIEIGDGIDPAR